MPFRMEVLIPFLDCGLSTSFTRDSLKHCPSSHVCLLRTTQTSSTCELRRTRRQRSSTVFFPQGRLSLFVPIRFDSPAANKIADILVICLTQRKSVKLNLFFDLLSSSNFENRFSRISPRGKRGDTMDSLDRRQFIKLVG